MSNVNRKGLIQKSSVENQKPNQFIIGGTLQVKKIGAKPVQVPAGYNPFKDLDSQTTTEIANQQSKKRNLIDEIIIDHSKKFISKQSNNLDANKRAEILGETEGIQQTNAQIYNNRFQAQCINKFERVIQIGEIFQRQI